MSASAGTVDPVILTVILVNHGTDRVLARCLDGLGPEARRIGAEVVVVDQPAARRPGRARPPALSGARRVVGPPGRGFAAAVNRGLRAARGAWVLLLNPDTAVAPGALEPLVGAMARRRAGGSPPVIIGLGWRTAAGDWGLTGRSLPRWWHGAGGRGSLLSRLWPGNPASRSYLRPDTDRSRPGSAGWVSGAALAAPAGALRALGGLEEEYVLYAEDLDLCTRARAAGWEVLRVPAPGLTHLGGAGGTARRPAVSAWTHHRSLGTWLRRHRVLPRALRVPAGVALVLRGTVAACGAVLGDRARRGD